MTVREACKRRHGDGPCVRIYAADLSTVVETRDCAAWCPLLHKPVDELYVEPVTEAAA